MMSLAVTRFADASLTPAMLRADWAKRSSCFTSMTTVVVTNLATYSTYARNAAAIRSLERRLSQFSPRRRPRPTGRGADALNEGSRTP